MDIRKLQRAIVNGLEEVKAQDIVVFNTEHLSPLFERVIVASGTSNRQTRALAASVRDEVRRQGFSVMRTEGEENGEWIIVDCGAAVAHIMQPNIRQYYNLEEIWGEKPVRLKLGGARGLPKATEGDDEGDAPAPKAAKKAPARKAAAGKAEGKAAEAKKPAAKKAAAGKPAASAKKAAAKKAPAATKTTTAKAPARKTAAAAPVKKVVINAPARKSAPAKKAAAAKKPAAKAAPKATTARKSPARKGA